MNIKYFTLFFLRVCPGVFQKHNSFLYLLYPDKYQYIKPIYHLYLYLSHLSSYLGHLYKHYTLSGLVSISNAAFSPCGLLSKLWFANQMNQVCLRFGLHPAVISSDFAFADCPLSALWLAVARQLPRLTAETQRQNKYNQNKQASCRAEALWKATLCVILFFEKIILGGTGIPKPTHTHSHTHALSTCST